MSKSAEIKKRVGGGNKTATKRKLALSFAVIGAVALTGWGAAMTMMYACAPARSDDIPFELNDIAAQVHLELTATSVAFPENYDDPTDFRDLHLQFRGDTDNWFVPSIEQLNANDYTGATGPSLLREKLITSFTEATRDNPDYFVTTSLAILFDSASPMHNFIEQETMMPGGEYYQRYGVDFDNHLLIVYGVEKHQSIVKSIMENGIIKIGYGLEMTFDSAANKNRTQLAFTVDKTMAFDSNGLFDEEKFPNWQYTFRPGKYLFAIDKWDFNSDLYDLYTANPYIDANVRNQPTKYTSSLGMDTLLRYKDSYDPASTDTKYNSLLDNLIGYTSLSQYEFLGTTGNSDFIIMPVSVDNQGHSFDSGIEVGLSTNPETPNTFVPLTTLEGGKAFTFYDILQTLNQLQSNTTEGSELEKINSLIAVVKNTLAVNTLCMATASLAFNVSWRDLNTVDHPYHKSIIQSNFDADPVTQTTETSFYNPADTVKLFDQIDDYYTNSPESTISIDNEMAFFGKNSTLGYTDVDPLLSSDLDLTSNNKKWLNKRFNAGKALNSEKWQIEVTDIEHPSRDIPSFTLYYAANNYSIAKHSVSIAQDRDATSSVTYRRGYYDSSYTWVDTNDIMFEDPNTFYNVPLNYRDPYNIYQFENAANPTMKTTLDAANNSFRFQPTDLLLQSIISKYVDQVRRSGYDNNYNFNKYFNIKFTTYLFANGETKSSRSEDDKEIFSQKYIAISFSFNNVHTNYTQTVWY